MTKSKFLGQSPRVALMRAPGAVLVSFAIALGASGCTGATTDSLDLPEKNIDQWVMPLDEYKPSLNAAIAANYAEILLTGPCMREHGLQWDVPYRDLTRRSETQNADGRQLLNREIAAVWGYQRDPLTAPNQQQWQAFDEYTASFDPDQVDVLRSCQADVRESQLPITDDLNNFAASLGAEAHEAAVRVPAVAEAAAEWRNCMSPLGVSDLPADPTGMPAASQLAAWGLNLRAADSSAPTVTSPSIEQIEAALTDSECRGSSGWNQALYDAEWNEQVELVREFQTDLVRNRETAEEISEKVAEIVAENAPTAG